MRTPKILATAVTVLLISSASASSLNEPQAQAENCSPVGAISLVGSLGAVGVVVISPQACRR